MEYIKHVEPRTEELVQLDEVGEFLIRAARRVQAGWTQGNAINRDKVCMIGSLQVEWQNPASPIRDGLVPMMALNRLRAATGLDHPEVWNDQPGRTQDEVVELMVRAAYNT